MTANTPPRTCNPQPRPGVTAWPQLHPRAQLTAPRACSPRHTRSTPSLTLLLSILIPEKLLESLQLLFPMVWG